MEFDDLITFILLFAFFILPSILKKMRGKNIKKVGVKKKRSSIFGKLGEGIQQFLQELEKQAQAAKQKAGKDPQESVWDGMADTTEDGIELVLSQESPSPAPAEKPIPTSYDPDHPFVSPRKKSAPVSESVLARTGICTGLPGISGGLPAHPLQQAWYWSEILGKPVALRND